MSFFATPSSDAAVSDAYFKLSMFPSVEEQNEFTEHVYEFFRTKARAKEAEKELLLRPNPDRYVVSPIMYPDIHDFFKQHQATIWHQSEIDLTTDVKDWNTKLTDKERTFLKYVLAFFAGADGIVLENLGVRFFSEVQIPEARSFYAIQMYMETVHSFTYAQLLDAYIQDPAERATLFSSIQTVQSVRMKAEWAKKWIASGDTFATRLLAFACVEGIFFSCSFCAIFRLRARGILPGLQQSNNFIVPDEGLHQEFATLLYTKYVNAKCTTERVHQIVREAVEVEHAFVDEALREDLLGMNATMMKEYVCFVANRLVESLQYPSLYPDAKQPFGFMERLCYQRHGNFFERRITDYQMQVEKSTEDEIDHLDFGSVF